MHRNRLPANRSIALSLLLAALSVLVLPALAQSGPPRVSPMATVTQVVGVSEVAITYSRPSVKDRTIWGELVPYDEVWRTGANEATTLSLQHEATIGGQKVPAGKYALFTIPGKEQWTIVLNKEADQWGAFQYKQAEDQLRFTVKPASASPREAFEISFPEVTADSVTVSLRWQEMDVRFPIQFDAAALIVAKAREEVADASTDPARGREIWNWANYCYVNGLNTEEALAWASDLAEKNDLYWTHALEAKLLGTAGKPKEALAAAEKAVQRAEGPDKEQPGVQNDLQNLEKLMDTWKEEAAG